MIYDIYFNTLSEGPERYQNWYSTGPYSGKSYMKRKLLAQFIKQSEDNTFIFILPEKSGMYTTFMNDFIKKYGLEENIVFEPSQALTNKIHLYNERNLRLVVLASSSHFWRELYED